MKLTLSPSESRTDRTRWTCRRLCCCAQPPLLSRGLIDQVRGSAKVSSQFATAERVRTTFEPRLAQGRSVDHAPSDCSEESEIFERCASSLLGEALASWRRDRISVSQRTLFPLFSAPQYCGFPCLNVQLIDCYSTHLAELDNRSLTPSIAAESLDLANAVVVTEEEGVKGSREQTMVRGD